MIDSCNMHKSVFVGVHMGHSEYVEARGQLSGDGSLARHSGHMPLIPALGKQSQADLCECKASLIYRMSSRTGKAM